MTKIRWKIEITHTRVGKRLWITKVEDLGITKVEDSRITQKVEDSRITQKVEDKDNAQKKGISKRGISR